MTKNQKERTQSQVRSSVYLFSRSSVSFRGFDLMLFQAAVPADALGNPAEGD